MREKHGKMARFDKFYRDNIKIVYKTALRYSDHDERLAVEVVSSTFLKLYMYLDHMKPDNIKNWLIVDAKIRTIVAFKKISNKVPDTWHNISKNDIFLKLYEENYAYYEAVVMAHCSKVPVRVIAKVMEMSTKEVKNLLLDGQNWICENFYEDLEAHERAGK